MSDLPAPPAYLKAVFPIPIHAHYWYRNNPQSPAWPGFRVETMLGRRKLVGYIVEGAETCPIEGVEFKTIIRTIDKEKLFGEETMSLARWVADMYFCTFGEALASMLPTARRESDASHPMDIDDFQIGDHPLELNPEQQAALNSILSKPDGMTYLYGPTGTGKTEVFLQAAEKTLQEGRSVLYLVPEIALTAQVVRSARLRFGDFCAVIHSRLTPSQKLAEWARIRKGEARIVIGARSAIFAPLHNLGLIVVDEEHEGSYKSGSTPRYHARQVAMYRAAREKARLVFGSATPSAEAWRSFTAGIMTSRSLTTRPGGGAFPAIEVVDMNQEASTLSKPLIDAIRQTKDEGRQTILFLNRRGFSHFFSCSTCGAELKCKHCSVSLTYHKEQNMLVCHYCGYRTRPPEACPECGSLDTSWHGFGTEKVEEDVRTMFPDLRISRLDADSITRKGSLEKELEAFRKGEIDILLGTQMVAKGLNFPKVKTVGVVLADSGLNVPDFRAAERVFSLIIQVAGRAGRYTPDGKVFIQTFRPDNPVIRLAASLDMQSFYARELSLRESMGFPPFGRLARIVVRSKNALACKAAARDLGRLAGPLIASEEIEVFGPAECAFGLIAGNTRWHLLFRSASPAALHKLVNALLREYSPPSSVHLEPDMDPVDLL